MTIPIARTRQVTVTQIICGVDISSTSLDARVGRDGASAVFPNTAQGIAALADFCRSHYVVLVAMEATGGYAQQPFALLSEQGLGVAIRRQKLGQADRGGRCEHEVHPADQRQAAFAAAQTLTGEVDGHQ